MEDEEWYDYVDIWEGNFYIEKTEGHAEVIEEAEQDEEPGLIVMKRRIGFIEEQIPEKEAVKMQTRIGFQGYN